MPIVLVRLLGGCASIHSGHRLCIRTYRGVLGHACCLSLPAAIFGPGLAIVRLACLGIAYEQVREWCLACEGLSDPCSGSDGIPPSPLH